jgi:hypothetical protein
MADITEPLAIRFCNEQIRTEADSLVETLYRAQRLLDTWDSQHMGDLIPPTNDPIKDGSPDDARPGITGMQVNVLVAGIRTMVNQAITPNEQTGIAFKDIFIGMSVNPRY